MSETSNRCESGSIDLIQIVSMVIRRKKSVFFTALTCFLIAVAYIALVPREYEVSAQLRPGVVGYDNQGNSVKGWIERDIISWINDAQYFFLFSEEGQKARQILSLNLKSKYDRGGGVIKVFAQSRNPERTKELIDDIFMTAFKYYKKNDPVISLSRSRMMKNIGSLKSKLELTKSMDEKSIDLNIASKKKSVELLWSQVRLLDQKQASTEATIRSLSDRINSTHANTEKLIQLRDQVLSEKPGDALSSLMYANTIQQNLSYLTQLQVDINGLKNEALGCKSQKDELEQQIGGIQKEIGELMLEKTEKLRNVRENIRKDISVLEEQITSLTPFEVVTPSTIIPKPVSPKVVVTLALGLVVGSSLGILFALLFEAWGRRKPEPSRGPEA